MKKSVPYFLFAALFVYTIIMINFASRSYDEILCKGISVNIVETDESAFVWEEDVLDVIKKKYGNVVGQNLVGVDKNKIRECVIAIPSVKSVDVYYSLDGTLYVDIEQRKPVFRVESKKSFYIDEDATPMPLSSRYTARVPVITGEVTKEFAAKELLDFVNYIEDDDFFASLFVQICVYDGELLLVPNVGDFKIRLGDLTDYKEKLDKLRFFLKEGIEYGGWNIYKEINLKYKDQVVCVKK